MREKAKKKSLFYRFIDRVEILGNRLPHPFYLFSMLIVVAVVLSVVFAGVSVTYEKAQSGGAGAEMVTVTVLNLLNKETVTDLTENMYSIYYSFSPMMMMGLLMLSIGLCEQVGFFAALIKRTIAGAKPVFVFAIVSFIAINANTASNAGILGCTAVAAAVFASMGYNPWLGILLAYAAGNAGMSANVFVGNLDVLLSGINESVVGALGMDTSSVHVLQNWYFMAACAVTLTVAYTWITVKFVRGYIGEAKDLKRLNIDSAEKDLTEAEKRGLRNSGIAALVFLAVLVAVCLPADSVFRADDGSIVPNSPLLKSVLTLLFLFFLVTGTAYGRTVGVIDNWNRLPKLLSNSLSSMQNFMVIALPASVFIYLFNASNIPTVLGVKGAELLQSANIHGFALLVMIALLTLFLNLFMTSGSSKWMILAPIFIPMFLAIGFSPALTTVAYRIGDSTTNAIAPISTDIALIVGLLDKYNTDKDKVPGMGTVFAGCLPYAIITFIVEIIILLVWWIFDLPLGPGIEMFVGGMHS